MIQYLRQESLNDYPQPKEKHKALNCLLNWRVKPPPRDLTGKDHTWHLLEKKSIELDEEIRCHHMNVNESQNNTILSEKENLSYRNYGFTVIGAS